MRVHRFAHVERTCVFSGAVRESLMEQMILGGCLKEVRKPAMHVHVCVHVRVQEHSGQRLCWGRRTADRPVHLHRPETGWRSEQYQWTDHSRLPRPVSRLGLPSKPEGKLGGFGPVE